MLGGCSSEESNWPKKAFQVLVKCTSFSSSSSSSTSSSSTSSSSSISIISSSSIGNCVTPPSRSIPASASVLNSSTNTVALDSLHNGFEYSGLASLTL